MPAKKVEASSDGSISRQSGSSTSVQAGIISIASKTEEKHARQEHVFGKRVPLRD